MSGKPRVHELAKELGVSAKEVLLRLSEMGEFVRSASSTVERPVARRLREAYPAPAAGRRGAASKSPAAANASTAVPFGPTGSHSAGSPAPPRRLTPLQAANICRRFRQASASGLDQAAINQLYLDCEAQYLVSQDVLRAAVTEDFNRYPGKYVVQRHSSKVGGPALARGRLGESDGSGSASASTPYEFRRLRSRTDSLPPILEVANIEGIVDLIMNIDASQGDRDEVGVRVRDFVPDRAGRYGYLAWRCSATLRRGSPDLSSRTPHHDLAVMAHVVDSEKQLLDQISHAHGPVLGQPNLAERVLDAEFSDLIDGDDIGRSAADELRHVRAGHNFLRLALVLAIASPGCNNRLWGMLPRIRPPAPDNLVETSPLLESSIARHNEFIADVETLFTTDEAPLGEFFLRAHTELNDLHAGRFDVLGQFRDIVSTVEAPRGEGYGLPFAVLPHGEQLRTFLDSMRSSGLYRGRQIDEKRVAVLEDIENHFGADRCTWHEGTASSNGFDNCYVVLAIKSDNDFGDHAVAISPVAGEHATYVVRSDCTETNWMAVLAQSKPEARQQGALKFLFAGIDPYSGMRAKVVDALECPRQDYLKRTALEPSYRRGRHVASDHGT